MQEAQTGFDRGPLTTIGLPQFVQVTMPYIMGSNRRFRKFDNIKRQ